MSAVPKITVADDPLTSTTTSAAPAPRQATVAPAPEPAASPPRRHVKPAPAPPAASNEDSAPTRSPASDPPPLDERLELVSARLPVSLAGRPARMAVKLRERTGATQKALPAQELIAVAVWAVMGDPDDPSAVEAFEQLLRTYRSRRYAHAAAELVSEVVIDAP
jgi:hypothetical protein